MRKSLGSLAVTILISAVVSACGPRAQVDADQAALDSLREAGSDLSKPHPFDFYLYHPGQSGAAQMCDQLSIEGFQTVVREAADEAEWLCLATIAFVPSLDGLAEVQARLSELAGQLGGEYDGWETIVVP